MHDEFILNFIQICVATAYILNLKLTLLCIINVCVIIIAIASYTLH